MGKISYDDFITKDQWPLNYQTSTHSTTMCGVTCDASSISQTSVKAKTIPELKCTAAYLGWLATDNDQQSYQRLSQKSERVHFCRWQTLWAIEHMMSTGWLHLIWH